MAATMPAAATATQMGCRLNCVVCVARAAARLCHRLVTAVGERHKSSACAESDDYWFYRREGDIGLSERLAAAWQAFRRPRK
jgi:hypothetical protein